jgi:ribosomal protein S18 acetylase RimI-like enzyme
MNWEILPIEQRHIPSYRETVDAVARERKFLALLEARPLLETEKFVLNHIGRGNPLFVVVSGEQVVGWCDIARKENRVVYLHCGVLGIGLLPHFRGRGIGRRLMETTIAAAFAAGMIRIELTVRESNANAITLYKSLGFNTEGLHRNAVCIDGQYFNLYSMALLKPP